MPISPSSRRGSWVDFNNDGLLDLLVDNSGFPPHSKLIMFYQNEDHSFEDQSVQLGVDITNPLNTTILDFNRDGKMDFITFQTDTRNPCATCPHPALESNAAQWMQML